MNLLKYYFFKKFWHNKHQGWMVASFMIIVLVLIVCHQTSYQWAAEVINDNLLLSVSIASLLMVKFVINRIYYISKINDGDINARGCADSSCLMTVLLFILLAVLTLKCCKKYTKFSLSPEEPPKEIVSSRNQKLFPNHNDAHNSWCLDIAVME